MIYKKLKKKEIITYIREHSNVCDRNFIEYIIDLYKDCHIDVDTICNKYDEILKKPDKNIEHLIGIYCFIAHLSIEDNYEKILEKEYKKLIKESIIKENIFSYLIDKSIYDDIITNIINELRI